MIQLSKADIGKKFITRAADVVEMIGWNDDNQKFPAIFSDGVPRNTNGVRYAGSSEDPHDIISRVEQEQPEHQPEERPEPPPKRIVITVMEYGTKTEVEGMTILEAFGVLNYAVRTFLEDKP